ncbi:alpha-2-macroglobulin-like [Stegastes partitus]|uniref:Alpha-2-macroglobulin-like n=1 Tax=Stegastes partitus TaxID=144197 RepID=A0A9Y4NFX4_9TELE|nr:PREDICTED: alpha-2-macroglobulin-like [Stegastes partitus]
MARPRIQMWTWTLCALWVCVSQALTGPQYMVTFPAVLEAGTKTTVCASLMQPNETLHMTVTLMSNHQNKTLLERKSKEGFHDCVVFKTPAVDNEELQNVEVKVQGNTFFSREVKKVLIKKFPVLIFIQMDKPIYLPGQTVNFRVVSLFRLFKPINDVDPDNNKIAQWSDAFSINRIVERNFALNSEAREGTYKVTVVSKYGTAYQSFKVEKYVLPKFEVTLNVSEEVSIGSQEISATVCAKLNSSLRHRDKEDVFDVSAEVEEEGTGISRTQRGKIGLSYVIRRLSFIDTPKIYGSRPRVGGKVIAVDYDNTPIPGIPVYLFEGDIRSPRRLQKLTTNSSGVASFALLTEALKGDVRLHASASPTLEYPKHRIPYNVSGSHTLTRSRPASPDAKTVSFLQVKKNDKTLACRATQNISIEYVIVGEDPGTVDLMYLVLSRGAIVMQGHKEVKLKKKVNEGEVSFKLPGTNQALVPEVQVVAYAVLPSENVIAHSAEFPIEKCFSDKVLLDFSPPSVVPGEDINMQLKAKPNSLCGVSAIDQSVLIKEPGKTLNADKIFDLLPFKKATYIPHKLQDSTECLHVRSKRSNFPFPGRDIDDVHTVFENVGLKVATNLRIQLPTCIQYKGRKYHYNRFGNFFSFLTRLPSRRLASPRKSLDAKPIETVRTFFPETWIWDVVKVGSSGTKNVSLTVPDTITTWETETFCLSAQGFGLAPRKEVTVFQPFFLDLTLPYSIVRGEKFVLKATVFNYLSSCIMIKVTPAASTDYFIILLPGTPDRFCLCGNERKTLNYYINPMTLGVVNMTVTAEAEKSTVSCNNEAVHVPDRGRIDKVTKFLIVKAEGVEKTDTHNRLLCPKGTEGKTLNEEIELQLPADVIKGSARALVSVQGDILGRPLKNLDGLLRMPYGCGEQNMALLAPNIYILQYLKKTKQLTPAIKEKAFNFLSSGYQRQLNYKHHDGSYSTFGTGTGNTWLTAFVLRSFVKAKSFVYIDPEKIKESRTWLEGKQQENGCFQQSGKLFNNRMKGGVSDKVTLTAYIIGAFLEMNVSAKNPVVNKSLSCLKEYVRDFNNTYTTALMAYVFSLAGDMETRSVLLHHLDIAVKREGRLMYWSQKSAETSASLSVEITSYVLMAKLSVPPSHRKLDQSALIVRWLTKQQNDRGGFSSTQDTVVALQALALYATLVYSSGGSSTVKVQTPSEQLTFDVNEHNKLLYQEKILEDVTGNFSVEVKGTACALVQITQLYNVPPPATSSAFSLEIVVEVNSTRGTRPKVTLNITVQYNGKENSTNMVILDIQMLSGFVPNSESLRRLKDATKVDRVEERSGSVVVYIEELPQNTSISYTLELRQEVRVQSLKPAVVKLYDYYQPSDSAELDYIYCTDI